MTASLLSKRSYASLDELSRDFWARHYARQETPRVPSHRLWQRMQSDGPHSMAARMWNNIWNLRNTNSAMVWLPDHPAVVRRFSLQNVSARKPDHVEDTVGGEL